MDDVRLANERQDSADAQARTQEQADEAMRRKEQAESDAAKAQAAKAQAESDTANAQAANAQAQSDAAQARNDAADAQAATREGTVRYGGQPGFLRNGTLGSPGGCGPITPSGTAGQQAARNRRKRTRRPCARSCPSS